jgi:hypothetical protein
MKVGENKDQMIDRDKTRINAYRNTRPGNLQNDKELQQLAAAPNNNRKAIPDLPLNFYNRTKQHERHDGTLGHPEHVH